MIDLLYQLQEYSKLGKSIKSIDEVISTIGDVEDEFEYYGFTYTIVNITEELIISSRVIGYRVVLLAKVVINNRSRLIKFYQDDFDTIQPHKNFN